MPAKLTTADVPKGRKFVILAMWCGKLVENLSGEVYTACGYRHPHTGYVAIRNQSGQLGYFTPTNRVKLVD